MSRIIIAKVEVSDGENSWIEHFKVPTRQSADAIVMGAIADFNKNLNRGEKKKKFEKIISFDEKNIMTREDYSFDDDWYDDDFGAWYNEIYGH